MRQNQRGPTALLLIVLLMTTPLTLFAQDSNTNIVGSGIVAPLFDALAEASEAELQYTIDVTGTNSGFEVFCAGEAAVVTATRAMTVAEEALCTSNEIEFGEIVLGYSAVAFIANPALDFLDCVTTNELSTVLAPSSIQNTTWSAALGITDQETEIEAYLPSADELTYFLADEILAGAGFRSDINTLDTEADILTEVAEANGGIGIVGLGSLIDTDDVMIVEIRNNTIGQCVAPTAESVGDGSYIAGTPLLMYVNTDVLSSSDELAAVATYVSDPASSDVLTASGFAPPTDFDYETNLEIASGVSAGRQFSRSLTEFQIPPTVAGTVNISGAAGAFPLLDTVASQFTQVYQGATINVNTLGEPAGLRALCNGETDIVATYGTISEQTLTNCEAADITVVDIQIGEQATVLVASESAEHLTCMTTEELVGVWGADATDTITTWVDVNEEYPDSPFFLFAGDPNNAIPNLMMRQAAGEAIPLRTDTETDTDPLYRAAATANTDASLTYMSWAQYQDVLENDQDRIQLVSVDDGDGCILPSEDTIASGEYPLSQSLNLAISQQGLSRIEVQSYLWFLFQDNRFGDMERANFDLLNLKDLFDMRATLQESIEEANAVAAQAAAEAAEADTSGDEETETGDSE